MAVGVSNILLAAAWREELRVVLISLFEGKEDKTGISLPTRVMTHAHCRVNVSRDD